MNPGMESSGGDATVNTTTGSSAVWGRGGGGLHWCRGQNIGGSGRHTRHTGHWSQSVVAGLSAGTETAAWPPPGTRPRHGAALGGGHRQHGARPRGPGHQGELVTVLLAREGLVLRNIGNVNAELD